MNSTRRPLPPDGYSNGSLETSYPGSHTGSRCRSVNLLFMWRVFLARLAQLDEFDAAQANFDPASPNSGKEVLTALDANLGAAEDYLHRISDTTAAGTWRLTLRGKEVFAIPRSGLLRSLMLNHWYHHRGQLSVYLRLLDVPLPVIYGRSADENPFA